MNKYYINGNIFYKSATTIFSIWLSKYYSILFSIKQLQFFHIHALSFGWFDDFVESGPVVRQFLWQNPTLWFSFVWQRNDFILFVITDDEIFFSPQSVSDNQIVFSHSDDKFSVIAPHQSAVDFVVRHIEQIECIVMSSRQIHKHIKFFKETSLQGAGHLIPFLRHAGI